MEHYLSFVGDLTQHPNILCSTTFLCWRSETTTSITSCVGFLHISRVQMVRCHLVYVFCGSFPSLRLRNFQSSQVSVLKGIDSILSNSGGSSVSLGKHALKLCIQLDNFSFFFFLSLFVKSFLSFTNYFPP